MEILTGALSRSRSRSQRAKDVAEVENAFQANLESIKTLLEQGKRQIVHLIETIYDKSFPEEKTFLKNPSEERLRANEQLVLRLVSRLGSQGVPVMPLVHDVLHKHGVESVASILLSLLGLLSPLLASREVPDFTSDDVLDAMDFEWQTSIGSPLLSAISSKATSPLVSAASKIGSPMNSSSTNSKSYSDRPFLHLISAPFLHLDRRKSKERKFLDPETGLSNNALISYDAAKGTVGAERYQVQVQQDVQDKFNQNPQDRRQDDDQLSSEANSPGVNSAGGTEFNDANFEADQESLKASPGIDLEEETASGNNFGAGEHSSKVPRVMDTPAYTQINKTNIDVNHEDSCGMGFTGDHSIDNIMKADNLPSKASSGTLVAEDDGLVSDNSKAPDILPGASSERSSSGTPSEASSILADASEEGGMVSINLGAEEQSWEGSSSIMESRTDVGSDHVPEADERARRDDCGAGGDDGYMKNKRDVGMETVEEEGGGGLMKKKTKKQKKKDDWEARIAVPSNIPSETTNVELPSPQDAELGHATAVSSTGKNVDNPTLLHLPHETKAIGRGPITPELGRIHNGDKTNHKVNNGNKNNKQIQPRKLHLCFCFGESSTHP